MGSWMERFIKIVQDMIMYELLVCEGHGNEEVNMIGSMGKYNGMKSGELFWDQDGDWDEIHRWKQNCYQRKFSSQAFLDALIVATDFPLFADLGVCYAAANLTLSIFRWCSSVGRMNCGERKVIA
jgi:hypothetical protein